jgi:YidC/Oxa1 family membrane protein insertase
VEAPAMTVWASFVDALEASLLVLTQAFGGNLAWAIVAFSLGVRIALLPLTYRIARQTWANRTKLLALRPNLEKLQQRFRKDPRRLMAETSRLYAKHDYRPTPGILGSLIQLPFFLGAFQALRRVLASGASGRFFWISSIARPDVGLALAVTALTYVVTLMSPQTGSEARWLVIGLPTVLTLVFLMRMGAGYGLYWGVSTLMSGVQSLMLRRHVHSMDLARS